jgi:hypothetical protein
VRLLECERVRKLIFKFTFLVVSMGVGAAEARIFPLGSSTRLPPLVLATLIMLATILLINRVVTN